MAIISVRILLPQWNLPAPQMDKGKQPVEEGSQRKNKLAVSVKSDKSIPGEDLMEDARHTSHEKEFF